MDNKTIYIDEVGRGNFYGPCIFCVVYDYDNNIINLAKDSKKTTKEEREQLFEQIKNKTKYKLYYIQPSEIDKNGLYKEIKKTLNNIINDFPNYKIIYDGNNNFGFEQIKTIIKADDKIEGVGLASIIAKYHLDQYMKQEHLKYPNYNFMSHSGYATKEHIEAVKKYGYLPNHRKSYKIKELESLKYKKLNDIF
jgi:ribonuclease HII